MLNVERILDIVSVESVIVHVSDYEPRRELTGKQFLVIAVQVAGRDSVGLTDDSIDLVLANPDSRALTWTRKTDGLSCILRTNKTALISLTL